MNTQTYTLTKQQLIDIVTLSHTKDSYPADDIVNEWLSQQHGQNVGYRPKYKVGDKARFTIDYYSLKRGDIVTITKVHIIDETIAIYEVEGSLWLSEKEIEPLN